MSSDKKDETTLKEVPYILIKGFLMGSADIVPGVSGGTLALILGIYERLLDAIKSVNSRFFKTLARFKIIEAFRLLHLKFLLTLLAGIFCAFAFFTRVVPLQDYMYTDPEVVFGLFFGLILGSIYILIKEVKKFRIFESVMLGAGIVIGFWVVTLVPTQTPENPFFIFFSGAVAICAMILPGISGSYILLILQKYDFMLLQLGKLGGPETTAALFVIIPFVLGAVVGIVLFSRALSWLLAKYHTATIMVLIGFLIGSLYVIWPYQHRTYIETVHKTEELSAAGPEIEKIISEGVGSKKREYKRPVNRELSREELRGMETVTVEIVERKLITSEPFWPGLNSETGEETPNVWGGIIGMVIGLVMVTGLEQLRKKS